jgi:hypothetical protein
VTLQVGAAAHRRQEGGGGVTAPAAAQRQLIGTDPVGARAIEIGIARVTRFDSGLDPGLAVRVVVSQVADRQFTVAAMELPEGIAPS